MTEIETDKLLRRFMTEHKQEVPDNGFSKRVLRHLPDRAQRLSDIWIGICTVIGVVLFLLFDGVNAVAGIAIEIFTSLGNSLLEIKPAYLLVAAVVIVGLGMKKVLSYE